MSVLQLRRRLAVGASLLSVVPNPFTKWRRRLEPPFESPLRPVTRDDVEIDDYTYGNPTVLSWGEGKKLKIGKFCSIAGGVVIFLGGNHRTDWVTTYPFAEFLGQWPESRGIEGHPASKGDVVIGNDVWIGSGATIMSGVKIADGAVIAARAVVTKDVEPYAIVAGNPARLIRKRFDDQTIRMLLEIKWWEWSREKIGANVRVLCSENVAKMREL
jgi:acetyltransferase-like isoleucine patch superfamily enzyme